MASTVPRQVRAQAWPNKDEIYIYVPTRTGSGLVRSLERNARANGAEILLRHRMTSIIRETSTSGRVLGITAEAEGRTINIRATKGVLIATGGHSNNVGLRRVFDPRLTEEYAVYKIEQPPFYAAWSTPTIHDSYTGLRTNPSAQVMDLQGDVIEGLYCAGECQGGFNQHGLGRSLVFGRIAGRHAALS